MSRVVALKSGSLEAMWPASRCARSSASRQTRCTTSLLNPRRSGQSAARPASLPIRRRAARGGQDPGAHAAGQLPRRTPRMVARQALYAGGEEPAAPFGDGRARDVQTGRRGASRYALGQQQHDPRPPHQARAQGGRARDALERTALRGGHVNRCSCEGHLHGKDDAPTGNVSLRQNPVAPRKLFNVPKQQPLRGCGHSGAAGPRLPPGKQDTVGLQAAGRTGPFA